MSEKNWVMTQNWKWRRAATAAVGLASLKLLRFHGLSDLGELAVERKGWEFPLEDQWGKIRVLARAGL